MSQKGTRVTVNAGRWVDAPGTVKGQDRGMLVVELDEGPVVVVEFDEVVKL